MDELAPLRPTSELDRRALKAAAQVLVDEAGGVTQAAPRTRVAMPSLTNYGAAHDPTFMPIDVVLDLERASRRPAVTMLLAEMQGFRLVAKDGAGEGALPGLRDLAHLSREASEAIEAVADAAADGTITPAELRQVHKEIEEACGAFRDIQARLAAAARGESE